MPGLDFTRVGRARDLRAAACPEPQVVVWPAQGGRQQPAGLWRYGHGARRTRLTARPGEEGSLHYALGDLPAGPYFLRTAYADRQTQHEHLLLIGPEGARLATLEEALTYWVRVDK